MDVIAITGSASGIGAAAAPTPRKGCRLSSRSARRAGRGSETIADRVARRRSLLQETFDEPGNLLRMLFIEE